MIKRAKLNAFTQGVAFMYRHKAKLFMYVCTLCHIEYLPQQHRDATRESAISFVNFFDAQAMEA